MPKETWLNDYGMPDKTHSLTALKIILQTTLGDLEKVTVSWQMTKAGQGNGREYGLSASF